MKTINSRIQIFTTFEAAKRYFKKTEAPAIFVQAKGMCTDYFVEKIKEGTETCIECWPTKYDLIEKK